MREERRERGRDVGGRWDREREREERSLRDLSQRFLSDFSVSFSNFSLKFEMKIRIQTEINFLPSHSAKSLSFS